MTAPAFARDVPGAALQIAMGRRRVPEQFVRLLIAL